jgi:RNA-directed DNA polymerase
MEQQKRKTEPRPAPGQGQERVGAPTFEDPALQAGAASSAGRIPSERLMEWICESENLRQAWKKVKANKGAPGIDGMTVEEAHSWLCDNMDKLKRDLLAGNYEATAVRRVEIPKPDGGVRLLGVPTVIDRLVQQAVLIQLATYIDPYFSPSSYGFRPGRSAHQALKAASGFVADGRRIVVDIDLEQFFDRVNHDILMGLLAKRIADKRVLKLIRSFLESGVMVNGVCFDTEEGTPQGGPLSPFLANLMLDELDKELEHRGHRFCRYADDCNIYVQTQAAGERVYASVSTFLEERLKLKVNRQKSAVAPVRERKFLGYRLLGGGSLTVSPKSLKRMKDRVRFLTKRNRPIPFDKRIKALNDFLRGWINYYQLARCKKHMEDLGGWMRRKLRCVKLKEWKRAYTIARNLISLGIKAEDAWKLAGSGKGWWRLAHSEATDQGLDLEWFKQQGLIDPLEYYSSRSDAGNRRMR